MPHETANAGSRWDLIPTPQHVEPLGTALDLSGARPVRIVVAARPSPKAILAAQMLKDGLEEQVSSLAGSVSVAETLDAGALCIRLVEWPGHETAGIPLNALDEQVLSQRHHGQSYIIRTLNEHALAVVGPPLGLLYGAMTLLQLLGPAERDQTLPGIYIRDFPSFQYRAAADWLLNGEANRWSLDRGQGLDAYEALCRRKLERCLRHKINMVVFDGFGFGLAERFLEYPALMRRLNAYARERGIHLLFGGYGSGYGMAYQPGPLYEDAPYQGTARKNRTSYPDGTTYTCMGYPRTRAGLDPGVFGTCRSNEDLNRLKARDLAAFVRAVEPGALYIHHEDFGGMDTTQKYWLERCEQCRRRWPNDQAAAADGAAGAVAHGYTSLVKAINTIRNRDTGYDASRDCLIILTSPVYIPSSPSSQDWDNALRFWQNVARGLPPADNLMACFREVFPQEPGGRRWTDAFNRAMEDVGRPLGAWIYFAGGGDHWLNDYPFVGTPALNAIFLGAQGIYNASGDAYQEPQQLLNAEYSWNARSDGFSLEPRTHNEAATAWRRLAHTDDRPAALFGTGGWLDRICRRLYGEAAAPHVVRYYSEWEPLRPAEMEDKPDRPAAFDQVHGEARDKAYLPMAYDKVYGVPVHWRRLALDAKTWPEAISNELYAQRFEKCSISRAELHARLGRQWDLIRRMSERSAALLHKALTAGVRPSSREDVEFVLKSIEVTLPLSRALIEFHEARRLHHAGAAEAGPVVECLERARGHAEEAAALACAYFPTVSDPAGAEVGAVRKGIEDLQAAIAREVGDSVGPRARGAASERRTTRGEA